MVEKSAHSRVHWHSTCWLCVGYEVAQQQSANLEQAYRRPGNTLGTIYDIIVIYT
jgi:hypothetical protein